MSDFPGGARSTQPALAISFNSAFGAYTAIRLNNQTVVQSIFHDAGNGIPDPEVAGIPLVVLNDPIPLSGEIQVGACTWSPSLNTSVP